MKKITPLIRNSNNEKIDTWVETPDGEVKANVVLVHGFGTSKQETAGYFHDIAMKLVDDMYRVVRFDLSGYGKSEGREEDACYSKHAGDLISVLEWTKSNYPEPIYILAQSMGCWVTALACPSGIEKTIMTGIPNTNTDFVIERFRKRFGSRPGAKLDMEGISLLPRSTGKIQKLGRAFWNDLKKINPLDLVAEYSRQTQLLIVHWLSDEIIGTDYIKEYDDIKGVRSLYLPGDHSVSKSEDRDNFLNIMVDYFNE